MIKLCFFEQFYSRKVELIDVVKYDGNDGEFVWKFPSEDLKIGSQLIVKTAQTAIFVKDGKILDQFRPAIIH